jgi:hypothetical protein
VDLHPSAERNRELELRGWQFIVKQRGGLVKSRRGRERGIPAAVTKCRGGWGDFRTSRSRIEHGSAEFHSRVCSADIKAPEQMRQLRTTGSLQEKVPDRAGVDRNLEAAGCK